METMEYAELKKLAKERRIKKYYVMPKAELVKLLSMPELPQTYAIAKKTYKELLKEAQEKNIARSWTKTKQELIEILYPTE
jgi:hypothetical protein